MRFSLAGLNDAKMVDAASSLRAVRDASQPPFCVATTFLDEGDRADAVRLGLRLYDLLTRNRKDPLSFGPGIPVAIGVDFDWIDLRQWDVLGEQLLIVVVAGGQSLLLEPIQTRGRIISFASRVQESVDQAMRRVLIQPTDSRWHREAKRILPANISSTILQENDQTSLDAILLQLGRFFARTRPQLYVSHQTRRTVRERISDATAHRSSLWEYFASIQDMPENSWQNEASISSAESSGVLVAILDDQDSERTSWERDVIAAKRLGWPVVVLTVGNSPVSRTSAYSGNLTTLKWSENIDDLLRIVVVEHLRACHFRLAAGRLVETAQLPVNTAVMSRTPELLDINSGILRQQSTRTILHPDPIVSPADRDVLHSAAPEFQWITPSTMLRRGASSVDGKTDLFSPLDGLRIGLSVSDILDGEFLAGQTLFHLQDILVQVARALVSGGASLTCGGNFSLGHATPFTPLIADIVRCYNRTFDHADDKLCLFQAANEQLDQVPKEFHCRVRHLGKSPDLLSDSVVKPDHADVPECLYTSDMRRAMAAETDARVVLGGKSTPRCDHQPGYSGRFSGVAEEVYRSLQRNQPVYLCGGPGGMVHQLARVMASPYDRDVLSQEDTHAANRRFVRLCWDVDHHPLTHRIGLPRSFSELILSIAKFFRRLGERDDNWIRWNGLSHDQNLQLTQSTDPLLISSLVCQGLAEWRSRRDGANGKLQIEAILGDITSVAAVDLLAIPVFANVEPQGAGAAVDRITGGLVSQARQRPGRIIAVRSDELDVDYLYPVSLGDVTRFGDSQSEIQNVVSERTRELVTLCRREGFKSLAMVTFAGSTLQRYQDAVNAILKGLANVGDRFTIKWIERSPEKYAMLVKTIRDHESVSLTTVTQPPVVSTQSSYPYFHITVKWRNDQLDITAFPSQGTGLAWSRTVPLAQQDLDRFCAGDNNSNRTPSTTELSQRGAELAQLIFGEHAGEILTAEPNLALAITHDAESSRLPFESLILSGNGKAISAPACCGGIHRLLAVQQQSISSLYARPKLTRRLRIGLVIDPTGNLPGAAKEGETLASQLAAFSSDIHATILRESQVTLDAMLDLLMQVDVLHFCGHALFDAQDPSASGLILANRARLTAANLRSMASMPRILMLNACQAARVRGETNVDRSDAYSLASMLLRSGIEAFVGTFWEVDDRSAADFAISVYQSLTIGETLRMSVAKARAQLATRELSEWANYILYGDGRFRLM